MEKMTAKRKKQVKLFFLVASLIFATLLIALLVLMVLLNITQYGISIVSFAATIFMILSKPKSKTVSYRTLIGSYLVVSVASVIALLISKDNYLSGGIAIISSIAAMALLDMEHPPALGMIAAILLNKFSIWKIGVALIGLFILIYIAKTIRTLLKEPHSIIKFVDVEDNSIEFNFREKAAKGYIMVDKIPQIRKH